MDLEKVTPGRCLIHSLFFWGGGGRRDLGKKPAATWTGNQVVKRFVEGTNFLSGVLFMLVLA